VLEKLAETATITQVNQGTAAPVAAAGE